MGISDALIVIVVSGGVVTDVYADEVGKPINYVVVDFDNIEVGDTGVIRQPIPPLTDAPNDVADVVFGRDTYEDDDL